MLATLALSLTLAVDIVGYHDPSDRIACVKVKGDSGAFAVRCGAKGRATGLLLGTSGKASRVPFEWRSDRPDIGHNEVPYRKPLNLSGVRCTFLREPSLRVRCRNDRYEIVVTRTQLIRRSAR